jgi:integrase
MKRQRLRHPDRALTAVQVRQITKPGRHADGNGLYLFVDPNGGAKRWVLRTVVRGRRRDIGLGGAKLISLAEARETAALYRKTARAGGDPLAEHRLLATITPTFEDLAQTLHRQYQPSWRNPKHAAQWISTLKQYVFPIFGAQRIDAIEQADVLRALSPIWLAKPETARRVKQRVRVVFDYAKAAGHRRGDNPVDGVARALPRQRDRTDHHVALPYPQVPTFIEALHENSAGEITKLALELLVLTATRTSEVLGARWSEIDFVNNVWTIPAERMKARRAHRVPLTPRALDILAQAKRLSCGSDLIFPGRTMAKPLSNMAFLTVMGRMGIDATVHGFRSTFRDWAPVMRCSVWLR